MSALHDDQKSRAEAWFKEIRDRICAAFELSLIHISEPTRPY